MNKLTEFVIAGVVGLTYLLLPVLFVIGWFRLLKYQRPWTITAVVSAIGFLLATGSALLALASMIYAQEHAFRYFDPSLMRIFRWGMLLSLSGFCFGIGGVWRRSSLRWFTPACGFGTLLFWVISAEGE